MNLALWSAMTNILSILMLWLACAQASPLIVKTEGRMWKMDSYYAGETGITRYLTPGEAELAEVHLDHDLRMTDVNGRRIPDFYGPYVVDREGRFLSMTPALSELIQRLGLTRFVHSSFLAADDVRHAGEVEVQDGKIISINNFSGHYRPNLWSLRTLVEALIRKGMDLSRTEVHTQIQISPDFPRYTVSLRAIDFLRAIDTPLDGFQEALTFALERETEASRRGRYLIYKRDAFGPLDPSEARELERHLSEQRDLRRLADLITRIRARNCVTKLAS